MYCNECEQYFETPYTAMEMHPEVGEFGVVPYEEYEVCPFCGSTEISPTHTCELCGEDKAIEYSQYCPECRKRGSEDIKSLIKIYSVNSTVAKAEEFFEAMVGEYFGW